MSEDLVWVIGSAIALVTMIGGIVGRDRMVMRSIRDGDDKLHARINELQRTLLTDYVRRSDLSTETSRFGKDMHDLKDELHKTNARLDRLIEIMMDNRRKEIST